MTRKSHIEKTLTALALTLAILLPLQNAFAQCGGTYFKDNYRKLLNFRPPSFNLDDWTNDGKLDFWGNYLDPATNTQVIIVYPNIGKGWRWDDPVFYKTNISANVPGFTLFDYNSDGKPDFNYGKSIYRNNGDGTFTVLPPDNYVVPGYYFDGKRIDLNGDGILDYVNRYNDANVVQAIGYRLGAADGTIGALVNIQSNLYGYSDYPLLVGDFAGDARPDVVYWFHENEQLVHRVLINNGNGSFTSGTSIVDNLNRYALYGNEVIPKDFNGDGKLDLVFSSGSADDRLLYFLKNNGNGVFTKTELPVFRANVYSYETNVRIVELNGDNRPDILEIGSTNVYSPRGTNFYSVHLNDGAGGFLPRKDYYRQLPPSNAPIIFTDYNGDGKDDLVETKRGTVFGERLVVAKQNVCQSFGETKVANFDAGLDSDLVSWNPNTGEWMSGKWIQSSERDLRFKWGGGWLGDVPALGDYDGDGKTDYAVYRKSDGTWYIRRSSDSTMLAIKFGAATDIPVPADYDGGGKTDIAVFRPSEGNWYIWLTETQSFSALHFGDTGDKPVPQDYDGDGKTDIAVYRPSNGYWYSLKSSNQSFVAIQWGMATDKPVPADYDGDGSSDIAVWRPSNGYWYIMRSANNEFWSIQWGLEGDVPVPVYHSDDHLSDETAFPVVYRPSTNLWYRFPSGVIFLDTIGNPNYPVYFGLPNN